MSLSMCFTIRHGKSLGETLKLERLSRVSGASRSRLASRKLQRLVSVSSRSRLKKSRAHPWTMVLLNSPTSVGRDSTLNVTCFPLYIELDSCRYWFDVFEKNTFRSWSGFLSQFYFLSLGVCHTLCDGDLRDRGSVKGGLRGTPVGYQQHASTNKSSIAAVYEIVRGRSGYSEVVFVFRHSFSIACMTSNSTRSSASCNPTDWLWQLGFKS